MPSQVPKFLIFPQSAQADFVLVAANSIRLVSSIRLEISTLNIEPSRSSLFLLGGKGENIISQCAEFHHDIPQTVLIEVELNHPQLNEAVFSVRAASD